MTEVAEHPETTELTVQDRAALALNSSKTEQDLKALAIKNVNITEIKDKPGREQAHGAAMELKRARTTIAATAKAARDDATKFSKSVIEEEKRLIGIIEPEETRLLGLRDVWDAEQDRIKAEREAAERARITAIHEKIAEIKAYHALAFECRTADRVQGLLDKMTAAWVGLDHDATFAEFASEAQSAYITTDAAMNHIIDQKRGEEAERAAIKATQEAAAAKLAAERAEFEAQQAAAKAEADRLKAIAAAQAAQDKAKLEAEQAAMALQRAQFEQEQAQMRETLAAQARKIAADMAEIEAKKAPESIPLPAPEEIESPAIESVAPATAPQDTGPSDADVIYSAAYAVSREHNMTMAQAIDRLAAINEWAI